MKFIRKKQKVKMIFRIFCKNFPESFAEKATVPSGALFNAGSANLGVFLASEF